MPRATLFANGDPDEADRSAAHLVRELARQGRLAECMVTPTEAEYNHIRRGAYVIAWPVVFERLTRPIEYRRGHARCARSVRHLEPDCLDMFHDDVEAVLDHLFRKATACILNLDGWIASRLHVATVDGNRRRRGQRGALQRPRLLRWLAAELNQDPWLTRLAVEMLTWVGVPTNAGTSPWPYDAWAEQRAAVTGDRRGADAAIGGDVDIVLAAMRTRRAWYEKFVERPLGRKRAPLLAGEATEPDRGQPRPHLALAQRHEWDEARLVDMAAVAVDGIEVRLRRGDDPRTTVVTVLTAVFGSGTAAEHMDVPPGAAPTEDEQVAALLADRDSLDRIVSQVLRIIADG